MTKTELAASADHVKDEVNVVVLQAPADVSSKAAEGSQRTLELATWSHLLAIGKVLLAYAFTLRCLRATAADVERRGLTLGDVNFRADASYQATLTTTVGPVTFPTCAYRDDSRPVPVTRTPARADLLSCYRRCRSSELCIEWETRLGTDLPFRTAQDTLAYFTHGAVRLEDTTVARHMVAVGAAITRDWLHRTPEQIAEILDERATCDLETKRPIVYASSDAVALRRYVDETWAADWKMANGLRLWCIDRVSGATIHLGGEYTFGDCQVIKEAVLRLMETGHLPHDGHYPGVHAQIVFVTDGMPWLEDRIINHFSDAIAILDLYHALENAAAYASTLHRKGSAAAKKFYARAARALLGKRHRTRRDNNSSPVRRDHKKQARTRRPSGPYVPLSTDRVPPAAALLNVIRATKPKRNKAVEARAALLNYIERNAERMDYAWFRSLGYQVGSGAMESLHRDAAQIRLKRLGARWLPETAEAIFSLRMLVLVGRDEEFWSQPDLTAWLHDAFAASARPASDRIATPA